MSTPVYTPAEQRARETFLALMHAFSYPGRPQPLPAAPADAFAAIADALLDLETSYFTPDAALEPVLAATGARALPAEKAAYHFYPVFSEDVLGHVRAASIGTPAFPDTAATLIFGGAVFAQASAPGVPMTWRGPGVHGTIAVRLSGVPDAWLNARAQPPRFPLGVDCFFVGYGEQAGAAAVLGLPRSTTVQRDHA
jgi:alpha-D-ribose 1-methylphosphonate 5-triphosphate synthase subunit PhnH